MEINPYYIAGLCEGEASFTYSRTSGESLNLYFAVRLVHDDKNLIYELQKYFNGIGNIYMLKPHYPTKNSGHTRAEIYYRVSKCRELSKIVNHFDRYPLLGKKAESYKIWKEIFLLKIRWYHNFKVQPTKQEVKDKINELAISLSSLTSKGKNKNQKLWKEELKRLEQGLSLT